MNAPVPYEGMPTPARYVAMAAMILGISLSVLDATIVNLALPGISQNLHASPTHAIWVVTAYQLAILALLLPLALLGDLLGHRKVYLGGIAIFTVASLGCALAPNLEVLVAARACQGVGSAGIMAVNAALVRAIYPSRLLGRGVAINSFVVATASVAGPSIAALILSIASWPFLFIVNLPLGLIALFMGLRSLPDNVSPPAAGLSLRASDVVMNALMFGLFFLGAEAIGTQGTLAGFGWPGGVGLMVAGAVVGVFYVRSQLHRVVPMLPIDLLRIPVFAWSMGASITTFAAQTLAYIALPFLFLGTYQRSHTEAGLLMTAWPLGVVLTAPLAGRLIGRYPDGLLGGIGMALMATGLTALALLSAHPTNLDIAWRMVMCGIGFGLFQSPNNHTIVTSAPPNRAGGASGMLGTARLTGQTFGAVLLATLFAVSGVANGKGSVVGLGFAAVLAAAAACFSSMRLRGPAVRAPSVALPED
jgi:DHA2 family multidrug resistance protein-like MFS transporter